MLMIQLKPIVGPRSFFPARLGYIRLWQLVQSAKYMTVAIFQQRALNAARRHRRESGKLSIFFFSLFAVRVFVSGLRLARARATDIFGVTKSVMIIIIIIMRAMLPLLIVLSFSLSVHLI